MPPRLANHYRLWIPCATTVSTQHRIVGYTEERGQLRRVGESHHNAIHTAETVQEAIDLKDDGWGAKRIAAYLKVNLFTVKGWLNGRRRSATPCHWRRIEQP